jgi:hypothetical protein
VVLLIFVCADCSRLPAIARERKGFDITTKLSNNVLILWRSVPSSGLCICPCSATDWSWPFVSEIVTRKMDWSDYSTFVLLSWHIQWQASPRYLPLARRWTPVYTVWWHFVFQLRRADKKHNHEAWFGVARNHACTREERSVLCVLDC